MANLEAELSATLFEKQGRNIKLTKEGKIFLEYVNKSLTILEEGIEKLKEINKTNINLAYVFPLSGEYIPKTIKDFLDKTKNSDISFTLKQDFTSEIINGLKNGKYDVGFCSMDDKEKNIVFEPVIEQKIVVIVPKNHILAEKKRLI